MRTNDEWEQPAFSAAKMWNGQTFGARNRNDGKHDRCRLHESRKGRGLVALRSGFERHYCISIFVGALALLSNACEKRAASAPAFSQAPPEVGVITLAPEAVAQVTELPGRTTAVLTAEVRPQINGVVTKRTFVEGSDVKAGQQLYQIAPALYQAAYDTAVAALQRNEAALMTARAKAERYKPLVEAQAVSRQDYDDARANETEALADIATAKAAIEQAKINLDYTKVMSPIAGRISRSTVTPGALATAQQPTALATVTQLDPIYVDMTQPAGTLLRLQRELASGKLQRVGDQQAKVKLVLEDGSQYPLAGTLEFSEVTVDESTGTVLLRALFPNPKHELMPGLYVRAQLQEGTLKDAMLVPQEGVSHNTHGDPTVLLVDNDQKVVSRTIQTDRVIGGKWIITNGLAVGDRVIVDGIQKARVGAQVRAVPVAATTASE